MAIVLSNAYKPILLDLERSTLNTYYYGLFVSNTVPTGGTILSDLTECSDGGYASTGRQHPVFAPATLNGSNQGQLDAPALSWIFDFSGGGFTVYGYFVASLATGGGLVYSERAAVPFAVTAAGQTYTVLPRKIMDTY